MFTYVFLQPGLEPGPKVAITLYDSHSATDQIRPRYNTWIDVVYGGEQIV